MREEIRKLVAIFRWTDVGNALVWSLKLKIYDPCNVTRTVLTAIFSILEISTALDYEADGSTKVERSQEVHTSNHTQVVAKMG